MKIRRKKCFHQNPDRVNVVREWNTRREAAARRAIQRERDRMPLFAADVTETTDDRRERSQAGDIASARFWRRERARDWRLVRRWLRDQPDELRAAILEKWNRGTYPATPEYLNSIIRMERKARGLDVPTGSYPEHYTRCS